MRNYKIVVKTFTRSVITTVTFVLQGVYAMTEIEMEINIILLLFFFIPVQ